MKRMFQGQLVLKTRCLECESFTERREDFQDISVPVLDEQPSGPADLKGQHQSLDEDRRGGGGLSSSVHSLTYLSLSPQCPRSSSRS